MKATIKTHKYKEVPPGTVGEFRGVCDGHFVIRVDGMFDGMKPSQELGKVDLEYHPTEVELEFQGSYTGPEMLFIQSFRSLAKQIHGNAVAKGFWDARHAIEAASISVNPELGVAARKAIDSQLRELIVSEIGEACEADRKDAMDDKIPTYTGVEAEMADAVIRILDYADARKLRLAEAIIAKMKFNSTRERLHGKAF